MSEESEQLDRGTLLVAPEVTRAKFDQQVARWRENAETYANRGWLLLSVGDLCVDIGMVQNVQMAGQTVPVMTVCVRIDYWNFDLWAPSVTFLDPVTREPTAPVVRAPNPVGDGEPQDALIDAHPDTLQPFLCLPGIREYHTHPQHTGDDWLLHRHLHEGDLAVVCERLWRLMARNVVGFMVGVRVQQIAAAGTLNLPLQFDVQFLQGDPDLVRRDLAQQAAQQAAFQALQTHVAAQQAAQEGQHEGPSAGADPVEPTRVPAHAAPGEQSGADEPARPNPLTEAGESGPEPRS